MLAYHERVWYHVPMDKETRELHEKILAITAEVKECIALVEQL